MSAGGPRRRGSARWLPLLVLAVVAAGCEDDDDPTGPGPIGGDVPRSVEADSTWILDGWAGLEPVGQPAVQVTWEPPAGWTDEVFEVYGRTGGGGDFVLVATVTSCTELFCAYTDLDVSPGSAYEYQVRTLDERFGTRSAPSATARTTLPAGTTPSPPAGLRAVALDNGVFLRWEGVGAQRYRIFLERIGTDSTFLEVGETDGDGFLDLRAENGVPVAYRVAAVDEAERVSARSALVQAIPRPDHQAELIYALADSASRSGFRFVENDDSDPILSGSSPDAQLRLEVVDGVLSFVPLGGAQITSGVLTTALACGPGSDPQCFSIDGADAPDAPDDFSAEPVAVAAELTYLVRVEDSSGRTHFGKIRVSLEGADQEGRDLAVFDWAYQLIPDEPSLQRR